MDQTSRIAFSAGVFDSQVSVYSTVDLSVGAKSRGIARCASILGLKPEMIAEEVSRKYRDKTDLWGMPAALMVIGVLHHLCLEEINEEMVKSELAPWRPWEIW